MIAKITRPAIVAGYGFIVVFGTGIGETGIGGTDWSSINGL
jgi:hypothetical protein